MASVVSFVRGIDLSGSEYEGDDVFPKDIRNFKNLRWLKIDRTGLDVVPAVLTRLTKLEHLSMEGNRLFHVPPSVGLLTSLRVFRAPNNKLTEDDIPKGLFRLKDITTIDLRKNELSTIPDGMDGAEGLIVLHLGNNKLATTVQSPLPSGVFVNCTELRYLNLENNELQSLPPTIGQLKKLQSLLLAGNPLGSCSLRAVVGLHSCLSTLDLSGTGRGGTDDDAAGFPDDFGNVMAQLTDLNLSNNRLKRVPKGVCCAPSLQRLNLSDNALTQLPCVEECSAWGANLHVLNVSRNSIMSDPGALLFALPVLHTLYANSNNIATLTLPHSPADAATLRLQNVHVSNNKLREVPGDFFRVCPDLRQLRIENNALVTLPEEVHGVSGLKDLRTRGNSDGFFLPPKPRPTPPSHTATYLIDFDAEHRRTRLQTSGSKASRTDLLGLNATSWQKNNAHIQTSPQRKVRGSADHARGQVMLDAMQSLGQRNTRGDDDGGHANADRDDPADMDALQTAVHVPGLKTSKLYADRMTTQGPALDYSDLFDAAVVGKTTGVLVWRMENFVPALLPPSEAGCGVFASGDCYIVLNTFAVSNGYDTDSVHDIFYWIGGSSSLDKKASAAIHALYLRGFLKAGGTGREEQGEESSEFLALFPQGFSVVEGGTATGFFELEEEEAVDRLYVLHTPAATSKRVQATAVPMTQALWQAHLVLLLETKTTLFLWRGAKVRGVEYNRTRLFATRLMHSPGCDGLACTRLVEVPQGAESEHPAFHQVFQDANSGVPVAAPYDYTLAAKRPTRVFEVRLGKGYLELPQVSKLGQRPSRSCLFTDGAYVVDDYADIFVWLGCKSSRVLQAAATRLVDEVERMVPRPAHVLLTFVSEGHESGIFKSKFSAWDEVLPSDHRTPAEMHRDTALQEQPWQCDVADLFASASLPVLSPADAARMEEQWTADLEKLDAYVLQGNNFVRLPPEHVGTFHTENCYVFLCKEWHVLAPGAADAADSGEVNEDADAEASGDEQEELACTAYFWQGRDAGVMGWLIFSFSFLPQIDALIRENLQCNLLVKQEFQNKESMRFLALFDRTMVVHHGHRHDDTRTRRQQPRLYHGEMWEPSTYCRFLEVDCTPARFCQGGCFLLHVPPADNGDGGTDNDTGAVVYKWIGPAAPVELVQVVERLNVALLFPGCTAASPPVLHHIDPTADNADAAVARLPPAFASALGVGETGTLLPPAVALPIGPRAARVFVCHMAQGAFAITEKIPQVYQDDLTADVAAIVSNTKLSNTVSRATGAATAPRVFLWVGRLVSEPVLKLASAAAATFARVGVRNANGGVAVECVQQGNEPLAFTQLFHGWARSIDWSVDLARPVEKLKHVLDPLPPRPPLHRRHDSSPFYLHIREGSTASGGRRRSIVVNNTDGAVATSGRQTPAATHGPTPPRHTPSTEASSRCSSQSSGTAGSRKGSRTSLYLPDTTASASPKSVTPPINTSRSRRLSLNEPGNRTSIGSLFDDAHDHSLALDPDDGEQVTDV
eukprot:m.1110605 g.1110605  ORF g.1110605 m.1110605 type:complete len:1517 (-) comp24358_c0_seq2:265-4815(-)